MKLIRKMVTPTIWLIVISFVLWGGQSVITGLQKESAGVGRVFGKTVTFKEFQDAIRSASLFMQSKMQLSQEELESSAWQNIVLIREAKKEGIQITDEEVLSEIKQMFGSDEDFNQRLYENWVVKSFGEQPRQFEERVRNLLRVRKLVEKHQISDVQTTEAEVKDYFFKQQSKVMVEFAKFEKPDEASRFFENHAQTAKWDEEKNKKESKIATLGPINLSLLPTALRMSEENAQKIIALEKDQILKPVESLQGYVVAKLVSKELADQSKFDEAVKKEYTEKLVTFKKQKLFSDWWSDLLIRAKIEKF